jgi:hypothetical protein
MGTLVVAGIFPGFDTAPIILMLETAVVAVLLALFISEVGCRRPSAGHPGADRADE